MEIHYLNKTDHGKVHGFITYRPDEREQALNHMERLNRIRDEQHHNRPPRARRPWTSHTLDSWDGSTMITFSNFHELESLTDIFE